MKIAIVHGVQRGGAARRIAGTVAALPDLDNVVLKEFSLAGSTTVLPSPVTQIDWLPQAPAKSPLLRPWWRYRDTFGARSAWSRLWSQVNEWKADVVFANPCFVPGGAPPGVGESTAPVLYYCDEPRRVDYEKDAARASNPLTRVPYAPMRRIHRRDERASVFAATRLATNSAFTAGRIKQAYGRSAEVITPGIAEAFHTDLETFDPDLKRHHILSVGTLIPSKGHDLVIGATATAQTDRPVFVVAPRANPSEFSRLHKQARELGVDLSIMIGIPDDELAELYRSAFVTMYLAREEPLGLVSLEAQACGTPVIVANDGGLVETLSDGVSGYHVARTIDAAADALRRMKRSHVWKSLAVAAARRPVPRNVDAAAAVLRNLRDVSGGPANEESFPSSPIVLK